MDAETKKLIADLAEAYKAMREKQDEHDAQIKARGSADATTTAAVEKANAAITALEEKIETQQKQLRDVETAQARQVPATGSEAADKTEVHARTFKALRVGAKAKEIAKLAVDHADIKAFHEYRAAFWAWIQGGKEVLVDNVRAALQVGVEPDGGYWVPPDTSGKMVELIRESSPMRQYASVQSIASDQLEGSYDLDEVDSGWVSETGSRGEADTAQVGAWKIPVHEQYAAPKATQKIIDDAIIDVEGWLTRKVVGKFSRVENTAYVSDNGVGKPRGFLTYAAGVPSSTTFNVIEQVNTGAAGNFAATDPGDVFIDTIGKMKEPLLPGCIWAMRRTTKAALRKLQDADGAYLLIPDFRDGFREMLLGFPVVGFEDMPAIAADSLSIAFANFGEGYQIVDRLGIRVLRDPYTNKPYVIFYSIKRTGGDVVNFEAIKLIKFAA